MAKELSKKTDRTVTLVINPWAFRELEKLARNNDESLSTLYSKALKKYLLEQTPDRLTVYAAPTFGKRIRVILDFETSELLLDKTTAAGFAENDVVYTAFEYFLDPNSKKFAA